jgi:hypothetical protein
MGKKGDGRKHGHSHYFRKVQARGGQAPKAQGLVITRTEVRADGNGYVTCPKCGHSMPAAPGDVPCTNLDCMASLTVLPFDRNDERTWRQERDLKRRLSS